jgi:UDP-2,3-diacylglucosamine hydrolase
MSIIFISDLHLDETHPKTTAIFLKYLNQISQPTNTLYILGDFFEVWIGDDDLTPFHLQIINALQAANQKGLSIYILHGNRDFLLGKKFLRATGCKLLPDEYVVNLFGVPTLLMHGDTLCTQDIKYLKFRKKSRNWFFQKLFLMKSLKKRRKIAENYREKSKSHVATLADYIMDVTQDEVLRVMQKYHVQQIIHGHTHRQAIHTFELGNKNAARVVLGAWHDGGTAFVCEEKGNNYFISL